MIKHIRTKMPLSLLSSFFHSTLFIFSFVFFIVFVFFVFFVFSCGHATLSEALSIGPSVGLSVRRGLKSRKTSIYGYFLSMLEFRGWVGVCIYGWGLDAPAHPSATIL